MYFAAIDTLCNVVDIQNRLIRKQAEVIAQMEISDEVSDELEEMRRKADTELDIAELQLREVRRNEKI